MKTRMKKLAAGILTAVMTVACLGGATAPTRVSAATNKAARVPVSFSGAGWDEDYGAKRTDFSVALSPDNPVAFSGSFTLGYKVFIPKPVLKNDGSAVMVGCSVDLSEYVPEGEDEWYGNVPNRLASDLQVLKDGSSYPVTYWDGEKDVDASQWATAKASGDYIVLTVKNFPLNSQATKWESDEPAYYDIDTSKQGWINANIGIVGVGTKISSFVYIDDIVLSSGTQSVTQDFSATVDWNYATYYQDNNDQGENNPAAPIEAYTNKLLTLKKTSATIKTGKTVKIKATAAAGGKITYKSSNKKVATVTSKGVVKGVKKGTAKIKVTANGVTKTFKVTVK